LRPDSSVGRAKD